MASATLPHADCESSTVTRSGSSRSKYPAVRHSIVSSSKARSISSSDIQRSMAVLSTQSTSTIGIAGGHAIGQSPPYENP